ncbi:outer membrane protein [Paracoccus laeviglucosivorans]|uniref:Outer membrane immunogenic protein n=1 Tax=Paracoccus laeviglucosivorans TaxID=1197861 RepID=A0A521FS58_9RHOB|nr:outer membrane beta-barrel protein [Paracoccus laeviglucosivorans]SMO99063.1 outer membrane immunogenic protein [Paracoccus laeviglucosivorans]
MTIKHIVVVATTLVIGTGAAHSGGYVPPVLDAAPIVAVVEAPVGSWQGGYVGATVGYAFKGDDRFGLSSSASDTLLGDIGEMELKGANAGLRAGYRWQRGSWVFGPEIGIEGGDIKGDTSGLLLGTALDVEAKVNHMIALRFKTGYAVRPDLLVYGIAGVGRIDIDYDLNGVEEGLSKTGYILGLGVEKQINDNWSVTGEYEYANFGNEKVEFGDFESKATPKYNNIKVGVNYRF